MYDREEMKATDAYNADGVEHVVAKGLPAAEAKELAEHLKGCCARNTDHGCYPVFNPHKDSMKYKDSKKY